MVSVTCPECGTVNKGPALECEKCSASLVGLQRTVSPEEEPPQAKGKTYPYDFFVPEFGNRSLIIPSSHCSSCYAELVPLSPAAVAGYYARARLPKPARELPYLSANLQVASSQVTYSGNYRITRSISYDFNFPLCKQCFFDRRVLKDYEPALYDPTCKVHKIPQAIGWALASAGLIGFFGMAALYGKFFTSLSEGALIAWMAGSFVTAFLGAGIAYLSKSFDRNLAGKLQAEAQRRYREVRSGDVVGEKRLADEPNLFKAWLNRRTFHHFQLKFRNEQYRNLLAEMNKWEDMSKEEQARELEKQAVLRSPIVQDDGVAGFYQATLKAWSEGLLDGLNPRFKTDAAGLTAEELLKKYPPIQANGMAVLFERFKPDPGEYLIALGMLKSDHNRPWFVLTSRRLIQRDGRDNEFKEVILAEVASYKVKARMTDSLTFQMKTGRVIDFDKTLYHPNDKYLGWALAQSAAS
jgi:hypothetical protein